MQVDPFRVRTIIRQVALEEILPRFKSLQANEIIKKNDGEVVTIADIAAERRLAVELKSLLPGSIIIGEEGFSKAPILLEELNNKVLWIIDPLDGTKNFVHGKACFAVMVTLVLKGEIEASWVHDPNEDRTIYAIRGEGAWENNKRLKMIGVLPIEEMVGSFPRNLTRALRKEKSTGKSGIPKLIDRYRSVGIEYMDLARGKLHFLRYGGQLKPWDHSAGVFIYREIGGYDALFYNKKRYNPLDNNHNQIIMLCKNSYVWGELSKLE